MGRDLCEDMADEIQGFADGCRLLAEPEDGGMETVRAFLRPQQTRVVLVSLAKRHSVAWRRHQSEAMLVYWANMRQNKAEQNILSHIDSGEVK